jgi:hypothetical protein
MRRHVKGYISKKGGPSDPPIDIGLKIISKSPPIYRIYAEIQKTIPMHPNCG